MKTLLILIIASTAFAKPHKVPCFYRQMASMSDQEILKAAIFSPRKCPIKNEVTTKVNSISDEDAANWLEGILTNVPNDAPGWNFNFLLKRIQLGRSRMRKLIPILAQMHNFYSSPVHSSNIYFPGDNFERGHNGKNSWISNAYCSTCYYVYEAEIISTLVAICSPPTPEDAKFFLPFLKTANNYVGIYEPTVSMIIAADSKPEMEQMLDWFEKRLDKENSQYLNFGSAGYLLNSIGSPRAKKLYARYNRISKQIPGEYVVATSHANCCSGKRRKVVCEQTISAIWQTQNPKSWKEEATEKVCADPSLK